MFKKNFCFYVFIFFTFSCPSFILSTEYHLAICTIFKNDAPWLKEWIEFHKIQGVEHFYLYNNNSTDNYKAVLNPYIKNKEVTLIEWSYTFSLGETKKWLEIQKGAYDHCLTTFGNKTQWLAFIDSDEFLFCPNQDKLPIFLKAYVQYGGLCVNWVYFGTSHIKKIPSNKLMIETLICCANYAKPGLGYFIKSIVQPKHVKSCINAHAFEYENTYFAVTADKLKASGGIGSKHLEIDAIRINHYWTRTEDYFYQNKIKSRNNRRVKDDTKKLEKRARRYNETTDKAIFPFVDKLRETMNYK